MRKCLLFIVIVFFNLQYLSAQDPEKPTFKRFGFMAGVNFSHMNFNKGVPPPPVPVKTTWKTGVFFGFLLQVPVTGNLSVQPEYLFSQLGGENKDSKVIYKLNYFSMPVLLKYQFTPKIAAMAGPQLDLLINAKKDSSGSSDNITHDTEERSFGLAIGLEFQILKDLGINARYMHGLNHVGIGQRSDVKEFKYELLQVSACIHF
ncbi:MAG: hypothetical protein JWM28_2516 [Chitinophagaceae bacterium]|nr:hypothetical protein [Chitinophagaceae bacterium]